MSASALVLPTINAPYGGNLDAHALAVCITDIAAATKEIGPVYSFFSEVKPDLQVACLHEVGVDIMAVKPVAAHFATMAGLDMPLAA